MTAWLYRWAYPAERTSRPFDWPSVDELLAAGWSVAGQDPRYGAVLMRREA